MTEQAKPFQWPIRVYYEDTDAQGVVYYANYFRFLERARTEWLRALGVNQRDLLENERRMFVVVRSEAEFLTSARFNDELIVTAGLAELTRASFTIEQDIFINDSSQTHCLKSRIVAAYLDADTHRPKRVPAELFQN